MARVTCAISGLRFSTEYLEGVSIPHTQGYFHPIFACSYKQLHYLYTQHCHGKLTPKDSYLLFLAFLHSTDQIRWEAPSTLDPNSASSKKLIENNLSQLLSVLAKTGVIKHPSFSQPSFVVTYDNCNLAQIPNWIKAWNSNIEYFKLGKASAQAQESLQKIENKLTYLILSGERVDRFSHIVADWADKAAEFPLEKRELYKLTIRSCFNTTKMFNTPLTLLKEIKDYCECNIEVGSVHFHTLTKVLKEGITRHIDYLGGSVAGYTLLPSAFKGNKSEAKNEAELISIAANAPESYPQRGDYSTNLDFLRAKLAFRVAINVDKSQISTTIQSNTGE